MSLPDPRVFDLLQDHFVVGWKNIQREEYVGYSRGYKPNQSCVGTTNGAGAHNVQLMVLSPDGTVLHALPGFWHPEDLARELRFGLAMHQLWNDQGKDRATKQRLFERMHQRAIRTQTDATTARSDWQGFDRHREAWRVRNGEERDTVVYGRNGEPKTLSDGGLLMKPINVLAHERMLQQPFRSIEDFDVVSFVDYGRYQYDLNRRDKGKRFGGLDRLASIREKKEQRAARRRAKEARRTRSQ